MKDMVKTKSSGISEGNESNNSTDENKKQSTKPKRYRGNKYRTKSQGPEIKSKTNFNGQGRDLEGYIFDFGPRALDRFTRTMKEMERYLGAT